MATDVKKEIDALKTVDGQKAFFDARQAKLDASVPSVKSNITVNLSPRIPAREVAAMESKKQKKILADSKLKEKVVSDEIKRLETFLPIKEITPIIKEELK